MRPKQEGYSVSLCFQVDGARVCDGSPRQMLRLCVEPGLRMNLQYFGASEWLV